MYKDVLISGASGFLGSVLSKSIKEIGANLTTLGSGMDNNIRIDLGKKDIVFETPKTIENIIHVAGKAHVVPKNKLEGQQFFDINFLGTKRLCNQFVASGSKIKSFIFISTVAVYGLEEGTLINESQPLNGVTPYAKSKILAEEWLKGWAVKNDVKLGILRLPMIAGPNPPGNLGSMIKGIAKGRYAGVGKSEARKSIVWAEDIACIIPKLAEIGGVYNLTDGYHPTFRELENCIAEGLGKKKPFHIPLSFAKGLAVVGDLIGSRSPITTSKLNKMTSTLTFDDSKAVKVLGWQPSPVLVKLPTVL